MQTVSGTGDFGSILGSAVPQNGQNFGTGRSSDHLTPLRPMRAQTRRGSMGTLQEVRVKPDGDSRTWNVTTGYSRAASQQVGRGIMSSIAARRSTRSPSRSSSGALKRRATGGGSMRSRLLQLDVGHVEPVNRQTPRMTQALSLDALDDARVIAPIAAVASSEDDLRARAATRPATAAPQALALGELPDAALAHAIDDTIGVNDP